MADNRCSFTSNNTTSPVMRETFCIEVERILDGCRDRDCFENVRVYLNDFGQEIIERTNTIRVKSACITSTNISVEPVLFNGGFFQCVIRFYVKLVFEACLHPGRTQEFDGVAVCEKRVILFGGESNVNVFRSTPDSDFCSEPQLCECVKPLPTCVVEAVDPIVLGINVVSKCNEKPCKCCCCNDIPDKVKTTIAGNVASRPDSVSLVVSLGFFTVIRLTRPAQMVVNGLDYSVPEKQCVESAVDDPCGLFGTIEFPVADFTTQSICQGPTEQTKPARRCCR